MAAARSAAAPTRARGASTPRPPPSRHAGQSSASRAASGRRGGARSKRACARRTWRARTSSFECCRALRWSGCFLPPGRPPPRRRPASRGHARHRRHMIHRSLRQIRRKARTRAPSPVTCEAHPPLPPSFRARPGPPRAALSPLQIRRLHLVCAVSARAVRLRRAVGYAGDRRGGDDRSLPGLARAQPRGGRPTIRDDEARKNRASPQLIVTAVSAEADLRAVLEEGGGGGGGGGAGDARPWARVVTHDPLFGGSSLATAAVWCECFGPCRAVAFERTDVRSGAHGVAVGRGRSSGANAFCGGWFVVCGTTSHNASRAIAARVRRSAGLLLQPPFSFPCEASTATRSTRRSARSSHASRARSPCRCQSRWVVLAWFSVWR